MANKNRMALMGLVSAFVLPVLLAAAFFQWTLYSGSKDTTNYGDLVSPMIEVNEPLFRQKFEGKWSVLFISESCSPACAERLKLADTVRLLTNEQMRRVQTVFVSTEPLLDHYLPDNIAVPNIQMLILSEAEFKAFANRLNNEGESIFLVDPLSRVMMTYPVEKSDIKQILYDLNRLLKYSRIG